VVAGAAGGLVVGCFVGFLVGFSMLAIAYSVTSHFYNVHSRHAVFVGTDLVMVLLAVWALMAIRNKPHRYFLAAAIITTTVVALGAFSICGPQS
jgi:hypothetical protein